MALGDHPPETSKLHNSPDQAVQHHPHTTSSHVYYHPRMWLVMHSVTSVCLSVCPVGALTFENLYLGTSFSAWSFIFRISRSSSCIKIIGSSSQEQEWHIWYTHLHVVCLLPSIERQAACRWYFSHTSVTSLLTASAPCSDTRGMWQMRWEASMSWCGREGCR